MGVRRVEKTMDDSDTQILIVSCAPLILIVALADFVISLSSLAGSSFI
jgi:hypothetical protein